MQTKAFLDLNKFNNFSENNCTSDPSALGRELNRPNSKFDAFKKTAKAEKNDSPNPTIAEWKLASRTEYFKLFFINTSL